MLEQQNESPRSISENVSKQRDDLADQAENAKSAFDAEFVAMWRRKCVLLLHENARSYLLRQSISAGTS